MVKSRINERKIGCKSVASHGCAIRWQVMDVVATYMKRDDYKTIHPPLPLLTKSSICFSNFGLVVVPHNLFFSSESFFISFSTMRICFPSAMRSSSFIIKLSESTVPPAKEPKNPLVVDIPDVEDDGLSI